MSHYGICARIDGVPCGLVILDHSKNGRYQMFFDRELAPLEKIEGINWAKPSIEVLDSERYVPGLPVGYGFTLEDISYQHSTQTYVVTLQTAEQFLGDVAGYQAQVTELREQVDAAQAETEAVREAARTREAELKEQMDAASQEAEAIRQSAADREAALALAYEEGVESNG